MDAAGSQDTVLEPALNEFDVTLSSMRWRVHLFMAGASTLLLFVILVCSAKTSSTDWWSEAAAAVTVLPISAIPALLWQDRKKYMRRDAALMLPWTCLLIVLFRIAVILSAQLRYPLRDDLFIKADQAMGFNVPRIMAWTAAHRPVDPVLGRGYYLLLPLLIGAMLLPALLGKRAAAEQFVVANAIAFLASFPLFAFLPSVGPWYGYHFPGSEIQKSTEATILALHSGVAKAATAGIITFPSFHVIWAVLSAWALWSIKPVRILAIAIAFLAVVSTVTTGWHYVADVIAGLMIAAASEVIAYQIIGKRSAPLNTSPTTTE
jgi:hypothetical protein